MRGKRLHRLLRLIALLRGPSRWNARRLAEHFRTSRRNVYRDLAVLELAGVPYYYDPHFGEGGGYRIRDDFWFPAVGLTDQECLDLAVLTRAAEGRGVPLLDAASDVRDKLLAALPPRQRELIHAASGLFDVLGPGACDPAAVRPIMTVFQQALLAGRRVEGLYDARPHGRRAERVRLEPRRVFLAGSRWYAACLNTSDGTTGLYPLARFRDLRVTDEPCVVAGPVPLRELIGNAWGVRRGDRDYRVEILFDPEAAPLVEEVTWHPTQELETIPGGTLLFRATVSGLDEIRYWVLGWGPRARVLRPPELAEAVRDLAAQTLSRYEPAGTGGESVP